MLPECANIPDRFNLLDGHEASLVSFKHRLLFDVLSSEIGRHRRSSEDEKRRIVLRSL